ncbi:E3 ubiquitin-protein ligase ZNRF4 [Sorex araneus]|uniref:E3 ubiquitin-protein ligase ZNRF4 n=1 Tax=Sorex araneus TaxID=42254 RepID=UPI0024333D2C|nr:E3 ubiquitin-protein ligase ZNRF4 [Sorex araneus]
MAPAAPLLPGAALLLCTLLAPARAVVRAVLESNASSVDFPDLPALFGGALGRGGVRGYLLEARPANGCHPLQRPGPPRGNGSLGAIALIRRYDCTFDLKVLHAQRAGFRAAIVHNVRSDALVRMAPVREARRRQIVIPAVFVGEAASHDLRGLLRCHDGAHVLLLPERAACARPPCRPLLLAASWALLGRALALLASTVLLLRRLAAWLRTAAAPPAAPLPPAAQSAQVRTFTRRHDLCAICLDDYEEGDRLKILPCAHAYHCRCIDPWFAHAARRACPVCKEAVAPTDDSADSAADSRAGEDRSLPGHRPPVWAVQARLRTRRLQLLAASTPPRAPPRPQGPPAGAGGLRRIKWV